MGLPSIRPLRSMMARDTCTSSPSRTASAMASLGRSIELYLSAGGRAEGECGEVGAPWSVVVERAQGVHDNSLEIRPGFSEESSHQVVREWARKGGSLRTLAIEKAWLGLIQIGNVRSSSPSYK